MKSVFKTYTTHPYSCEIVNENCFQNTILIFLSISAERILKWNSFVLNSCCEEICLICIFLFFSLLAFYFISLAYCCCYWLLSSMSFHFSRFLLLNVNTVDIQHWSKYTIYMKKIVGTWTKWYNWYIVKMNTLLFTCSWHFIRSFQHDLYIVFSVWRQKFIVNGAMSTILIHSFCYFYTHANENTYFCYQLSYHRLSPSLVMPSSVFDEFVHCHSIAKWIDVMRAA